MDKLKLYNFFIVLLAMISISFVILDFMEVISIGQFPYQEIDWSITAIFSIDYFVRFYKSPKKIQFFKNNIFDLLAIIPLDSLFSFFRLGRIFKVAKIGKVARFSRFIGLSAKLKRYLVDFLHTNGLIYMLYINAFLVLCASLIISIVEESAYDQSLWWAIVTTTTVGYGDIVPSSFIGKSVAVILMLVGIGTIGMLTSALTVFFVPQNEAEDEIEKLKKEIQDLKVLTNEVLKKLEK